MTLSAMTTNTLTTGSALTGSSLTLDTLSRPQPAAQRTPRWLAVVSHLDPRYGGLSTVVPQLAREVSRTGQASVELAAFCLPSEEYVPDGFDAKTLRYWPAGRMAWRKDTGLRQGFGEDVRQADALHVHGIWEQSAAIACRLAREQHKPYVLSAHGMLEPWALSNKRLKKYLYAALIERANVRGAACLHALTQQEAQSYRRFGATGPIAVIPNAVTVPSAITSELFLSHFPFLCGKRIVLFLARLHPKKGLDLLVPAFAAVARRWPEAQLVIAGPDFEGTAAAAAALVARHGIAEQVLFAGMLDRTMKWSALAAAECFVLPSRSEGLSMSALEAMGAGLPLIVTQPCNMSEVPSIGAGWEVPLTIDALTGALTDLLAHSPATNAGMGAKGRRRIAERHGWSTVARQMAQVYDWVLGAATPADVEVLHG